MINKRKKKRFIILILLVLLVVASLIAYKSHISWKEDHVCSLELRQRDDYIYANWDGLASDEYTIVVSCDDKVIKTVEGWSETSYKLGRIDYLKDYIFAVSGKQADGSESPQVTESIHTLKPQSIKLSTKEIRGFKDDEANFKISAKGAISTKIGNEEIAEFIRDDRIHLNDIGRTELVVSASETNEYLGDKIKISITCYPNELEKPALNVRKEGKATAVFYWEAVEFADSYELLKYVKLEDKYRTIRTFSASEVNDSGYFTYKTGRTEGSYKLRAVSKIGDKTLKSTSETAVKIESTVQTAKTYSSLTTTRTLNKDDLDFVAKAQGSEYASNAQSMCVAEGNYVIALVNSGNNRGCLEKIDRKGNILTIKDAGDLGHANGCTYDPLKKKIYVMKTYSGSRTREMRVFDGDTLTSCESLSLRVAPSAIAYDISNNRYYFTASARMYVKNGSMESIQTLYRKRCKKSQDVAGYNGIIMTVIWPGGSTSYIDMYRNSDGAYLGSIAIPLGEVESCAIDEGKLVILMAHGNIYRTKNRIALP